MFVRAELARMEVKMESLWKKTENTILEDVKKLDKQVETEVCIIGGRNHRDKYSIWVKQKGKKGCNSRKRKISR